MHFNEKFFNRTQNDAIWGLIALFLTNQNAGNTIDFKMNVINCVILLFHAAIFIFVRHLIKICQHFAKAHFLT